MMAVVEALPGRAGTRLVAVDYACFHDEGDMLEHADVFQWIAGHGDDVGVVAGLQDADLVHPVEQAGSVQQISLQDVERLHAVFHH